MARTANRGKRLLLVCPHCGKALDPRTAAQTKPPSPRAFIKQAILAALDKGPAPPREIEERMGLRGTDSTANLLRVLQREGKVAIVGKRKAVTLRGNITFIWARVIPTDSADKTQRPQPLAQPQDKPKTSKRGARA